MQRSPHLTTIFSFPLLRFATKPIQNLAHSMSFTSTFFSSSMLMGTGVIHCAFGLMTPELRNPLVRIMVERTTQVTDMADRYERECSFWFQFGGIMMISHGYLLRQYCLETGKPTPKWFGWFLLLQSLFGVLVMPESGFWLVLGQGLWILSQRSDLRSNGGKVKNK